jgi:hypothetical protein
MALRHRPTQSSWTRKPPPPPPTPTGHSLVGSTAFHAQYGLKTTTSHPPEQPADNGYSAAAVDYDYGSEYSYDEQYPDHSPSESHYHVDGQNVNPNSDFDNNEIRLRMDHPSQHDENAAAQYPEYVSSLGSIDLFGDNGGKGHQQQDHQQKQQQQQQHQKQQQQQQQQRQEEYSFSDDMYPAASSKVSTVSDTSPWASTQSPPDPTSFGGGYRRGVIKDKSVTMATTENPKLEQTSTSVISGANNTQRGEKDNKQQKEIIAESIFSSEMCYALRVPCRFVSDHPCCEYLTPLEMAARSRAMDGSADLKWRGATRLHGSEEQKESSAMARSLRLPQSAMPNLISYTSADNETSVQTPTYHYSKSPEAIYTILGQCWRLHYLRCGSADTAGHPCCQLVSNPGPMTPADNALTRWLDTSKNAVILL